MVRRIVIPTLAVTLAVSLAACGSSKDGSVANTAPTGSTATSAGRAVDTLIKRGIGQAEANELQAAAATFQNVLLVSPKNLYALYNLGLIAQKLGKSGAAISRYDQALEVSPEYTPAMYNKALILEKRNSGEALALYKQIVSINPKASTAWLRMAVLYAEAGESEQADEARERAIALDPKLASYPLPGH